MTAVWSFKQVFNKLFLRLIPILRTYPNTSQHPWPLLALDLRDEMAFHHLLFAIWKIIFSILFYDIIVIGCLADINPSDDRGLVQVVFI